MILNQLLIAELKKKKKKQQLSNEWAVEQKLLHYLFIYLTSVHWIRHYFSIVEAIVNKIDKNSCPYRAYIKKLTIPSVDRNAEQWKSHKLLVEMKNDIATLEDSLVVSYKV